MNFVCVIKILCFNLYSDNRNKLFIMKIIMCKTTARIIMEALIEDNNLSGLNIDRMVKSYLSIYKQTKGGHKEKNENAKFLILYYSHQYRA